MLNKTIRAFIPDDRDDYVKFSTAFYSSDAVDHNIPTENFLNTFDECLRSDVYSRGYMLLADGERVGYGLAAMTYSNEAGGKTMWLDELYILPEYRSQGFGKLFFDYVFNENKDVKRFRLEVCPSNEKAIKLYDRLNFKKLNYMQMVKEEN